ncbi:MAG: hypothetical protein AAFR11_10665 [Pseudomonadota bacterium]
MRALRAVLLTLAAIAAGTAPAIAGLVRIGEHESFTRLVVENPESRTWFHSTGRRTVEVRIMGSGEPLNLAQARKALGAGRIAALRVTDRSSAAVLTVTFNCECEANVFDFGGDRIVIDVFEKQGAAEEEKPSAARDSTSPRPDGAAETDDVDETEKNAAITEQIADASSAAAAAEDVGDPEEFEAARRRLLALLAQAANDGFVTLDQEAAAEEFASAAGPGIPGPINESIRVQRGDGKPLAEADRAPSEQCFADTVFTDDSVLDGLEGLRRIGLLRQELVGEFDQPDRRAAFLLARQYLHLGFGAEAANVLEGLGFNDTAARALIEAGRLLEDKTPAADGAILTGAYCRGVHAVWQAAALSALDEPEAALNAASREDGAVQRLSDPLLAEVSLALGEAAAAVGEVEEARYYLALAERSSGLDAARPRLLSALILQAEGDYERADYILAQLARESEYIRPDALIARGRLFLTSGETPDEDFLLDLAALAFERRRTPFGETAQRERIQLLAETGDITGAVFVLNTDFKPYYGENKDVIDGLRETIRKRIDSTHAPTQLATLEAFLANQELIGEDALADDIRLAVAGALIGTGLSNAAAEVLLGVTDARARDRALLAATAAYRRARFDDAVDIAAAYESEPEFRALTARALLAKGEAGAAAKALKDVRAETAPLVLAALWRVGRWDGAADLLQAEYEALATETAGAPTDLARRFALAAYMARRKALPEKAAATLAASDPELLQGLESFFTEMDAPSELTLDAAKDLAATTARELVVFEELTTDG